MHIIGTHHVALYTANFERLRAFYTETLGMPVKGGFEGYNIIFINVGSTTIELVEETGHERINDPTGWNHLALEVADVDAAYAELTAKGITFHILPMNFPQAKPVVRIAFFKDPDGNILELVQQL
jgi:glyoxylase I family protein